MIVGQPQLHAADLRRQLLESLSHHHLDKLLIIDLAIAIHVCLTDHLIYLLIREFFAQVCHDMAQLCSTDKAVAVTVEDLEGLNELFLGSVLALAAVCLGTDWLDSLL